MLLPGKLNGYLEIVMSRTRHYRGCKYSTQWDIIYIVYIYNIYPYVMYAYMLKYIYPC